MQRSNGVEERSKCVTKILDSFENLKKILREKAICEDDRIVIFDPPFTLHILKKIGIIQLYHGDEILATASKNNFEACDDEAEKIMEQWLKALTSVGYKRFLIKRKGSI
jgi:hypothetical protein